MSIFSDAEIAYLQQQRVGRLATVDSSGSPHVVPVGFHFDAATDTIQIGSREDISTSKKFKDARAHPGVAFVVDDFVSLDPPAPRGVEVRGRAETLAEGGEALGQKIWGVLFAPAWIRIRPERVISWGIEDDPDRRD